jgi:putative membrane protein
MTGSDPTRSDTDEPGPGSAPTHVETPELRRLHPFTPFLRSWASFGVLAAIAATSVGNDADRIVWVWNVLQGDADFSLLFKVAAATAGVACVILGFGWLSWRMTGFALVAEPLNAGRGETTTLLYHRGVLVRQRSRIRLDRVQSVDVRQPVVPRLLGLASVSLDMAAGSEASVNLAYLREPDAWELRDEILRYTAIGGPSASRQPAPPGLGGHQPGPQRGSPTTAPGAAPHPTTPAASPSTGRGGVGWAFDRDLEDGTEVVARVSTARLIQATMLASVWLWAVLLLATMVAIAIGSAYSWRAVLAAAPVVVLSFFGVVFWKLREIATTLLNESNFTLLRTQTGVRISSGLMSTVNRTIESDRIQAVRIVEPWTWRWFDWVRVEVEVAGAKQDASTRAAAALMPVADRTEAFSFVASLIDADLDSGDVIAAGPNARLLDPLAARFLGVMLLDAGAVTRLGRWRRTRSFVPYARVQSVTVRQGWIQRRLALATVYLDMPKGVRRWTAPHRALTEAADLVAALVTRARQHRAHGGHTWPGGSEPPLDAARRGADDEAEHQSADQSGLGVEHRPGEVRQPQDERSDDAEGHQRHWERSDQAHQHQHQDRAGNHDGRQG